MLENLIKVYKFSCHGIFNFLFLLGTSVGLTVSLCVVSQCCRTLQSFITATVSLHISPWPKIFIFQPFFPALTCYPVFLWLCHFWAPWHNIYLIALVLLRVTVFNKALLNGGPVYTTTLAGENDIIFDQTCLSYHLCLRQQSTIVFHQVGLFLGGLIRFLLE